MNFDEIPRAGSVSLRSGHAWRGTLESASLDFEAQVKIEFAPLFPMASTILFPDRGFRPAMLVFPEVFFVSFVMSILPSNRKLCASPALALTDVGGASRFLRRPFL